MQYLTPRDRPALEALGIEGWAYGFADRVRFYELDALNHVNNVTFLRWFETIRVAYLQDYGLTSYAHDDTDPQIVIRAQSADYFAPMFQNESYVLTARTTLVKPSSFIMEYAAHVDAQVRCAGSAVVVSLEQDGKTRRAHKPEAVALMIDKDGAATEGL